MASLFKHVIREVVDDTSWGKINNFPDMTYLFMYNLKDVFFLAFINPKHRIVPAVALSGASIPSFEAVNKRPLTLSTYKGMAFLTGFTSLLPLLNMFLLIFYPERYKEDLAYFICYCILFLSSLIN